VEIAWIRKTDREVEQLALQTECLQIGLQEIFASFDENCGLYAAHVTLLFNENNRGVIERLSNFDRLFAFPNKDALVKSAAPCSSTSSLTNPTIP